MVVFIYQDEDNGIEWVGLLVGCCLSEDDFVVLLRFSSHSIGSDAIDAFHLCFCYCIYT